MYHISALALVGNQSVNGLLATAYLRKILHEGTSYTNHPTQHQHHVSAKLVKDSCDACRGEQHGSRRRGAAHRKRLPLCTIGKSRQRNFSRCAADSVPSSLRPQLVDGKLSSFKAPAAACWAACDSSGGTATAPRAGGPPKRH